MDERIPAGVGWTAVAMAQERAVESARPDRLFDDPWTQAMVRAARAGATEPAPNWLREDAVLADVSPGLDGYVVQRTRFFDERLLAGLTAAGTSQVVLLGAGLDTRAARLPFPHPVTVFALDQPAVLACAGRVLRDAEGARTIAVPVDLTADWPAELLAHGFDPARQAFWVIEGLLMYLGDADAGRVLGLAAGLSAPGSGLLADIAHPNIHHNDLFAPGHRTLRDNVSPIGSSTADPAAFFGAQGWRASPADPIAFAERCGRTVSPALDHRLADGPTFTFVEASID